MNKRRDADDQCTWTREKKILLKEESETEKILQTEFTGNSTEIRCSKLEKVVLNLETKLTKLESTNDKVN